MKGHRMPRRSSAKRNILLAVLLVVLAGVLIVVMPMLRSTTPLIPLESAEVMAKRTAPETNAYAPLWEAMYVKPENPPPLITPDKANPQVTTSYAFERGSLGELLKILRPDDDPDLIRYVMQCDPVIAKVREALARPYFLLPLAWPEFADLSSSGRASLDRQGSFAQLGSMLVARSVIAVRQEQGKDALRFLLDAYRLALLLRSDGDTPVATDTILAQAWPRWFEAAHASSEADLRAALEALDALKDAVKPSTVNVEFALRMLDNAAAPSGWMRIPEHDRHGRHKQDSPESDEDADFARKIFFTTHMRRAHRFVVENRDALFAAVVMAYPEYTAWKQGHADLMRASQHAWPCDPMAWAGKMVRIQANVDLAYAAAGMMTGLELHRLTHNAYPESLEVLAPEYLKAVPLDPFGSVPFHYRRMEQDYLLYGVGMNQADDAGNNGKNTDDIVLHGPKGEPS
jgi:hypothetical protein